MSKPAEAGGRVEGLGSSPRSSLSSSSALVGLMTPSTSKPAKLLTSLWIRLSCKRGKEEQACRRGNGAKKEEVRKQSH